MSIIYKDLFRLIIFASVFALSGCGGGNSSDQAVISADTAQGFASNVFGSGPPASSTKSAKGTVEAKLVLAPGSGCDGIGEFIQTMDYDPATDIFSGTLEFVNFRVPDDCNFFINGILEFSGTSSTQESVYIDFETTYGIMSTIMNGNQHTSIDALKNKYAITMDVDVYDKNHDVKYHQDLSIDMTITEDPIPYTTSIYSGRLTHSNIGYVDITTIEPVEGPDDEFGAHKGKLHFAGASGSQMILTFKPGGFIMQIDSDGDGVFELSKTCDLLEGCV